MGAIEWNGVGMSLCVNRLLSAPLVAMAVGRTQWGSGQLAHCLLKLITAFYTLTNTDYCSRSGRAAERALCGATLIHYYDTHAPLAH